MQIETKTTLTEREYELLLLAMLALAEIAIV